MENVIKVLSANCQGLRDIAKRTDVLNYLRSMGGNILRLQETHWLESDIGSLKNIWKGDCFINGSKTNSRGVAILISPTFEYTVSKILANNEGNLLSIDLKLNDTSIRIINTYSPNIDSPQYFKNIESHILSTEIEYILLGGDLNLILDPKLDCDNYKHINNPVARKELLEIIEKNHLCDIYRKLNPLKTLYLEKEKPRETSTFRLLYPLIPASRYYKQLQHQARI